MRNLLIWFAGILADEVKKRLLEADVKAAVLNLQPGDKIILRHPRALSESACTRLTQQVEELFPGHKAIVLEEGLDIGTVRISNCKCQVCEHMIPVNSKTDSLVICPVCKTRHKTAATSDGEIYLVMENSGGR